MKIQIEDDKVAIIEVEKLPAIISESLSEITKADGKVKAAIEQAKKAKSAAEVAAKKSAKWSWDGSNKKEAIEALQNASIEMCKAQSSATGALEKSFVNQKKMSEGMQYLFGLGVMNMAANRTVVRELELKLKNASKEELSELARQELERVLKQLKAQQDMLDRVEKQKKAILDLQADVNAYYSKVALLEDDCQEKWKNNSTVINQVVQNLEMLSNNFVRLKDDWRNNLYQMESNIDKKIQENQTLLEVSMANQLNMFRTECTNVQKQCNDEIETIKNEYCEALSIQKDTFQNAISFLRKKSMLNSNVYQILLTISSLLALIFHFIE